MIWATGLIVIIEQNWLFSIPDLVNPPQVIKLPDPHLEKLPHCIAAIEPHTVSGSLEVNSVMGSTVLFVDADSVQDQVVSKGSLQKMALSPNDANFLTWFLYNSYLLVLYIEFSKILSKLSTEV